MPTSTSGVNNAYTTQQLAQASRTVNNELGKDAFLKLLIAELSNQDPLNPMSDREFIAQMAQFSSLEQMTNLNDTLGGMASMDKYSAVNYLGSTVFWTPEGSAEGAYGQVEAVWYDPTEGPMLVIKGYKDQPIPLYKIDGVSYVADTVKPDTGSEPDTGTEADTGTETDTGTDI